MGGSQSHNVEILNNAAQDRREPGSVSDFTIKTASRHILAEIERSRFNRARYRGSGASKISYPVSVEFQAAITPLFHELMRNSGVPFGTQGYYGMHWHKRRIRALLRYGDDLIGYELDVFPHPQRMISRCYMVAEHLEHSWHLDFDRRPGAEKRGVPITTTWSVKALPDDPLRRLSDTVMPIYTGPLHQGQQFAAVEYQGKAQVWYKLGARHASHAGVSGPAWTVINVRSEAEDDVMTESQFRQQLQLHSLFDTDTTFAPSSRTIEMHPDHVGTIVLPHRKSFEYRKGARGTHVVIDSIDVHADEHRVRKAGQITTPYNTIHSVPTTDKVSLDEIRFFVSTRIGKGEVHVGLSHAIDGTTELNLRF